MDPANMAEVGSEMEESAVMVQAQESLVQVQAGESLV
jgi:hypothetical protein